MSAPSKRQRPAGTGRHSEQQSAFEGYRLSRHRARRVQRLRATAQACGIDPVFIDEAPLRCEVFDDDGRLCGMWRARR